MAPEEALADNKKYKVVWQVLQALRAHDDRFNATINKIELTKTPAAVDQRHRPARRPRTWRQRRRAAISSASPSQNLEEWRDAIYAKIVQKCRRPALLGGLGDRHRRDRRAPHHAHPAHPRRPRLRRRARRSTTSSPSCAATSTRSISRDDAIEMLSQHLITRPVFDALFEGYAFAEHNPVSQAMQQMVDALGEQKRSTRRPRRSSSFYDSVRKRASGIDTDEGRQRIITELYEKFFKNAFPKMADRLGIVYTPIEVVDFIVRSVDARAATSTSDSSLADAGVHVLDPFTGTGTFIVAAAAVRPDRRRRPAAQVRRGAARQRDPAARLLHRRDQHRGHLPPAPRRRRTSRSPASSSPTPSSWPRRRPRSTR